MPPNTQQVCDNCRLRKTKCDRGKPCNNCASYSLCCQYLHNVARRGPKGGRGRRLNLIKLGLTDQLVSRKEDLFETSRCSIASAESRGDTYLQESVAATLTSSPASFSPSNSDELHLRYKTRREPFNPPDQPTSDTIIAHVETFMAQLFPIMPAVDGAQLLSDAANLEATPPPRRALLLSLCAVTRIQLKLDQDNPSEDEVLAYNLEDATLFSGVQFLAAAERTRLQFTLVDNMTEDAVMTSFFLFVSNGNLEKYEHAWFYLSQCISMAILLGYDRDPPPVPHGMSLKVLNTRRKIFWLLFITERTYALQRRMPIIIRGSLPPKPEILDSDNPMIMNDFLNHIHLFEALPASLYDWQSHPEAQGNNIGHQINEQLCSVEPAKSILESQHFDTLVTQQWLRVSMWRLSYGMLPNTCSQSAKHLSFNLPFDAGKAIMASLACVTHTSRDCHGISIEQKLFDIGLSLVDIATFAGTLPVPSIEVGPQDLLYAIVKTLGCVRGRQSRYLENLLNHSQIVLGLDKYGTQKSLELPHQPTRSRVEYVSEDADGDTNTRLTDVSELSDCDLESYPFNGDESHGCFTADEGTAHSGWPWPLSTQGSVPQSEISQCIPGQTMLTL